MDLGIRGRVAIVAAASRGLGKAVAEALAAEGAHLALCARTLGPLEGTAQELSRNYNVEVFHSALDVTQYEPVRDFVHAAAERFGRIDICVTNAGGPPAKNFLSISVEEWQRAVELNLLSAVYFAREVIPHMQQRRWGRLVTITSIAVKQPVEGLILSNSVRAAVAGLAKTLANEFGKDGILVNNVCPGYTLTQRLQELAGAMALAQGVPAEEIYARWAKETALGRLGQPEEFGTFVALLCSELAGYVTGTSIQIDGGLYKGLL